MSTTILHGQLNDVDEQGNVRVLYQENAAEDVKVNRFVNAHIPSSITNMNELIAVLSGLAFKDAIETSDFANNVVTEKLSITDDGTILDGRVGKILNDRIEDLDSGLLDYAVANMLQDSNGDTILDSDDNPIFGQVKYVPYSAYRDLQNQVNDLATILKIELQKVNTKLNNLSD